MYACAVVSGGYLCNNVEGTMQHAYIHTSALLEPMWGLPLWSSPSSSSSLSSCVLLVNRRRRPPANHPIHPSSQRLRYLDPVGLCIARQPSPHVRPTILENPPPLAFGRARQAEARQGWRGGFVTAQWGNGLVWSWFAACHLRHWSMACDDDNYKRAQ